MNHLNILLIIRAGLMYCPNNYFVIWKHMVQILLPLSERVEISA